MLRGVWIAAALALTMLAKPVSAHPHIFVDAKINLVVNEDRRLKAIRVVWLFDPFHTLYILSFDGITPTPEGGLTAEAQAQLAKAYTDWQPGFDGFAKLSQGERLVSLGDPSEVEARLLAGHLEISFTRAIPDPISIEGTGAEIVVYDATYYHAVTISEMPDVLGNAPRCRATLIPFEPDALDTDVQAMLSKLSRDEITPVDGIGASFADRITLTCA
ncbi:MAG: DUF1007 family protein [Pseudomonadota bacterium]